MIASKRIVLLPNNQQKLNFLDCYGQVFYFAKLIQKNYLIIHINPKENKI